MKHYLKFEFRCEDCKGFFELQVEGEGDLEQMEQKCLAAIRAPGSNDRCEDCGGELRFTGTWMRKRTVH